MNSNSSSILLLDDDNAFRGYLAEILNSRGLNVVEAGNAREANHIIQTLKPALAIVDFRLPGQDGFSWIASVRDSGKNFPIVVLSGTWCDEKTFSRLRNLLKVSLILRKPIAGDLFIQQIESLLPANLFLSANSFNAPPEIVMVQPETGAGVGDTYTTAGGAIGRGPGAPVETGAETGAEAGTRRNEGMSAATNTNTNSNANTDPNANPNTNPNPKPNASTTQSIPTQAGTSLIRLKSTGDKQNRLARAKADYGAQLPTHWSELVKALTAAREDKANGVLSTDAIYIAHRLRGTAGSIGFPAISVAAGKIEDMLHHLDPTDTLQEVIWTEIFRWLAEGELAVRAAAAGVLNAKGTGLAAASPETASPSSIASADADAHASAATLHREDLGEPGGDLDDFSGAREFAIAQMNQNVLPKVLLWGRASKYANIDGQAEVRIQVAETLPQVVEYLSSDNYVAVFIDLSVAEQGETLMGAKEIRALHTGHRPCVPLGCLMPDFDVLPEELVFAGFSVVLQHSASPQEIVWACKRLSTIQQASNPRVLTVDDDSVLTNFIATLLSAENITTETLNKPILIMETLEKFKPDIVLLDVMMPGLSGYDVCRMLRADEKWKDLSIIFLTSKSDQEGRAAAFQAGGDDFLSKPVLAEELLSRVRAQVEHKRVAQYEIDGTPSGTISGAEFMREATKLLEIARYENFPLSIALLSIDDFGENSINHGMSAASQSLRALTELTINHFRTDVLRGRIGEEGVALAFLGDNPETVGMALGILLLEYQELSFNSEYAQHPFKCSFSAGVAQFPESGATIHKVLSEANQRLMLGRREGRGLIRYAPLREVGR